MVIMTNAVLLKSIPYEEFDYQTLLDSVHGYAQPRMKISGMLAKGDIVRVKKGLYNRPWLVFLSHSCPDYMLLPE
jgi:hypothetical protein